MDLILSGQGTSISRSFVEFSCAPPELTTTAWLVSYQTLLLGHSTASLLCSELSPHSFFGLWGLSGLLSTPPGSSLATASWCKELLAHPPGTRSASWFFHAFARVVHSIWLPLSAPQKLTYLSSLILHDILMFTCILDYLAFLDQSCSVKLSAGIKYFTLSNNSVNV